MSSTRLSRAPPAIAVCGRENGCPCSGSPLGELFLEAVAAAKPTPLGVCPAGGGDQPRGSAPADSRLASKLRGVPRRRRGSSRGIRLLPNLPGEQARGVAAAKPTPLGVCPAGGGDQPRGSAPADSRLANKLRGVPRRRRG